MSPAVLVPVLYLLFFVSGAAALVYQVVWVRSLTLIFGGSHLAVTAVLSIFMGGLALGGYTIGKHADRTARPLRLYGLLELGIAASAVLFAALMRVYPFLYVAVAQGRDDAVVYLASIRMLFAVVALIVPTMLMGGTLPVLVALRVQSTRGPAQPSLLPVRVQHARRRVRRRRGRILPAPPLLGDHDPRHRRGRQRGHRRHQPAVAGARRGVGTGGARAAGGAGHARGRGPPRTRP